MKHTSFLDEITNITHRPFTQNLASTFIGVTKKPSKVSLTKEQREHKLSNDKIRYAKRMALKKTFREALLNFFI